MVHRLVVGTLVAASIAFGQISASVVVDGQTLWTVKLPRAGFTPAERAEQTRDTIIEVADAKHWRLDHARDVHLDSESILLIGNVYVFSVTNDDGRAEGKSRIDLFSERRRIAFDAITRYREARAVTRLVRSILLALAALAGAFLGLALLSAAYRRSLAWENAALSGIAGSSRAGVLYRELERPISLLANFALKASFLSVAAVVLLVSLSYAVGQFPATAGMSDVARHSALQVATSFGSNVLAYMPNLLVLILIAAFTYTLIRIARALSRAVESGSLTVGGFYREWAAPTFRLVRFVLIIFGLVVAFPYLPGGDSPALRGVSLFIGVLVSLGSGSTVGNAIAGIILTYMRPYQLGDRVKIADSEGDITEKSLLVTRIRTIKNVEVIVPNHAILGTHIVNYSANARQHGLIVTTSITIGYEAPWRQVRQLLINAALKTPNILSDPQPFVFHTSLNDFHVTYEINAYTHAANQMHIIESELHTNIQEEFNAAGIEIMSPTYLSLRDGNTVTIPASQRPPDYAPPPFRLEQTDKSHGASVG
jgi:small-conductance mechanosensitive channel